MLVRIQSYKYLQTTKSTDLNAKKGKTISQHINKYRNKVG